MIGQRGRAHNVHWAQRRHSTEPNPNLAVAWLAQSPHRPNSPFAPGNLAEAFPSNLKGCIKPLMGELSPHHAPLYGNGKVWTMKDSKSRRRLYTGRSLKWTLIYAGFFVVCGQYRVRVCPHELQKQVHAFIADGVATHDASGLTHDNPPNVWTLLLQPSQMISLPQR